MIKPILDNLLLEPLDAEEVNSSGLYRPETSQEKPSIGKILAVGPECKTLYRGKAVYKKWLGNSIKFEEKEYILVAEKDVLGVIK